MTSLSDLFDTALFDAMVDGGYVRVQDHPSLPLNIANYSERAQFDRVWNDVTLTCRGLIYDQAGAVVARPYRKFFNYGDHDNTGPLDLTAPAVVMDKLDGSLGISYPTSDGYGVATRGSFTSDQAIHATALLRERYPDFDGSYGLTYLWEIVYPANRIVVDYGDMDDLILHGAVDNLTGTVYPAYLCSEWEGPRAAQFPYATLADALAAEPRANAEGFVVHVGDRMVKIKQEDYTRLHRIITGLNAKTVWEHISSGRTVGDLCATVPDDFHGWIEDVGTELLTSHDAIIQGAKQGLAVVMTRLREQGDDWTRGEMAREVKQFGNLAPYLFLLYDGNDTKAEQAAWRAVKPAGSRSLVNHTEAVA